MEQSQVPPNNFIKGFHLESDLWIGDQVCVKIHSLDIKNHIIEADIGEAFYQMNNCLNGSVELKWLPYVNTEITPSYPATRPRVWDKKERIRRGRSPIEKIEHLLIVDDDSKFITEVSNRLENEFKFRINCARTSAEATKLLSSDSSFDLVLIDIHLDNESGVDLAEKIKSVYPSMPMIFFSRTILSNEDEREILSRIDAPLIDKEYTTIVDWIDRVKRGFSAEFQATSQEDPVQGNSDQRLRETLFVVESLDRKLQRIIKTARENTGTSLAVIVKRDPLQRSVKVIASDPDISESLINLSPGGLYNSQVRNVIEDEFEFKCNNVTKQDRITKFKNLFPTIFYQSIFGIPIIIPDQETQLALFLFDKRPWHFGKYRSSQIHIHQARLSAGYIALAIERYGILETLRENQELSIKGQLIADMVHEINNKQGALRTETARAWELIHAYPIHNLDHTTHEHNINNLRDAILSIKNALEGQQEIIVAYQHLVKKEFETVYVNKVISKATSHLSQTSKELGITIRTNIRNDIPPIYGIEVHLHQVILNILLNAIQQMKIYFTRLEKNLNNRSDSLELLPIGLITIQVIHDHPDYVDIFIADNGPGIHHTQYSKIFDRGYSNREGAGLGLPISRGMVEQMNGSLTLHSSILFLGSMFRVRLPIQTRGSL